jgi:hypothetical protein
MLRGGLRGRISFLSLRPPPQGGEDFVGVHGALPLDAAFAFINEALQLAGGEIAAFFLPPKRIEPRDNDLLGVRVPPRFQSRVEELSSLG